MMMIELLLAATMWLCDLPGQPPGCQQYTVVPVTATTTTVTVATSTTTSTTGTTLRTVYAGGYVGVYDPATITAWPKNPGMHYLYGGVDVQGPQVASMQAAAKAAGHLDATFLFYLGLGGLDSKCNCYEQRVSDQLVAYQLQDMNNRPVFTNDAGGMRVRAMDIGSASYAGAWISVVQAEIRAHGWQGVWADYVNRGCISDTNGFWDWSGWPKNPRTGQKYLCNDYRRDLAATLQQVKNASVFLVANHGGAWNHPDDVNIKAQVRAAGGVHMEDCVFQFSGTPQTEANWQKQLSYMQYANGYGTMTCQGYGGTLKDANKRMYLLATELLTAQGYSGVAQLNSVASWFSDYDQQFGVPRGAYECISGGTVVSGGGCPGTGLTYRRRYQHGVVAVNPTTRTQTIPLGQSTATCGTSVTLGPQSGKVCP